MKIVFMGTPEFAVLSLQILMSHHEVLAVITAPDKPAGRGHRMQSSAIKKFAINQGLKVLQPKNLKSQKLIDRLMKLKADIFIVVAFRMLPEVIWSIPRLGTINLHASLLPKYRGAAPIQWAIINGEVLTGLTVFRMNGLIDTGEIICNQIIPIGEDETGGELHDKMMQLGGELLVKSIDLLKDEEQELIEQDNGVATSAPKLFRTDCEINWNMDFNAVYNHIRALDPYPGAWFLHDFQLYKIFKCKKLFEFPKESPGKFVIRNSELLIACLNGYIEVHEIQPEGKRRMSIAEFLNGFILNHSKS